MIGHTHGNVGQAGADQVQRSVVVLAFEHKSKRSGPEVFGQCDNPFVGLGVFGKKVDFGNVRNQRIKRRPSLGCKNSGHGVGVVNVCSETVDGICRKCHKAAVLYGIGRFFEIVGRVSINIVHSLSSKCVQAPPQRMNMLVALHGCLCQLFDTGAGQDCRRDRNIRRNPVSESVAGGEIPTKRFHGQCRRQSFRLG